TAALQRLRPGDTQPAVLVPKAAGLDDVAKIAFGPDGQLWLWGHKDHLAQRFTVADDGTLAVVPDGQLIGEAKDAQGRVYEGDAATFTGGNFGNRHIRRQAPGGAVEVVAGKDAPLLGGTALDDSIRWAEDLRFDAARS